MFVFGDGHVTVVPPVHTSVVPAAFIESITRHVAPASHVTTQPPPIPSSPTQSTTQYDPAWQVTA
jgi:hypothetical protein